MVFRFLSQCIYVCTCVYIPGFLVLWFLSFCLSVCMYVLACIYLGFGFIRFSGFYLGVCMYVPVCTYLVFCFQASVLVYLCTYWLNPNTYAMRRQGLGTTVVCLSFISFWISFQIEKSLKYSKNIKLFTLLTTCNRSDFKTF